MIGGKHTSQRQPHLLCIDDLVDGLPVGGVDTKRHQ